MTRHGLSLLCLSLFVLTGCRKLPLEGKITGYKPGSDSIVLLHVKSNSGAYVECMPDGLSCSSTSIGGAGEVDIELTPALDPSKKKVILVGKHGPRSNQIEVPLDASVLPPKLAVDSEGRVSCTMRECTGTIALLPTGKVSIKTQPGAVLEIGANKATANAQGAIEATFDIPTTTPLRTLPLKTLCALGKSPLGSTTVAITFPDKVKVTTQATFSTDYAKSGLNIGFKTVASGPAPFSWEKGAAPPSGPNRKVALYVDGSSCAFGGAIGATVADIDVVVLGKDSTREDPVGCVYNLTDKNDKDKGQAKGKLTLHDVQATAYDRLTSKQLGTKAFQAQRSCRPDLVLKENERVDGQDSYADRDAIAAWGASLAR